MRNPVWGWKMAETFSVSQYNNVLNSASLLQVYQLWSQYLENLRQENRKLSAFWMSYIHLVGDVLLGLILASWEGNWLLRLCVVHHMIPRCFAYEKFNYARYLLVYYAQMANVPVQHPGLHQNFTQRSNWTFNTPRGHTPGIWLCIVPGEGGIWTLPWKGGEFEPDLSLVLT